MTSDWERVKPELVWICEFSSDCSQELVVPILHQWHLTSIEDHTNLKTIDTRYVNNKPGSALKKR